MRSLALFAAFVSPIGLPPLVALAAAASPAMAQSTIAPATHPYAEAVADAARRFGVPEAWIWAVMRAESGGDRQAVSAAGAQGLMQIMPATWATLRVRYNLGSDPFDVRANIMAGAAYLRELHDRYGDPVAMLAAYNAGPGRYDDYRLRGRPLPTETIAYLTQLAPVIGGSAIVATPAAPPPDPLAWTRAMLFVHTASATDVAAVEQASDTRGVSNPPADAPANAPPDRRSHDDGVAAASSPEPPADTLFVRRAGAGRPQ